MGGALIKIGHDIRKQNYEDNGFLPSRALVCIKNRSIS